jgi:CTP:molybdopterin cytidylyltransferase MocA
MKTAALILAAGASTRLGQPKQLVRLGEETLLGRAIRIANEAGCEPIVVVLGANKEEIEAVVPLGSIHVVHNEEWQEGMASSIRAGLRDLAVGMTEGVLVMACDQPRVTVEHLRALLGVNGLASSGYAGRRGVPAVFPRDLFSELMKLQGDAGARDILQHETVTVIELPGGEVDIDTPEDLEKLK